ncbi:pentafunctional AROM polypeptide [Cordyceps javanica]|nr:pentafunctional AROM polypeptide [Cordyceps javanica]
MAAVHQLLTSPSPSPGPTTAFEDNSTSSRMDVDNGSNAERASQSPLVIDSSFFGDSLQGGDARIVVVIYGKGQESIVSVFGEVLGKPSSLKFSFSDVNEADHNSVIGIAADTAQNSIAARDHSLIVTINAHFVHLGMPPNLHLSEHCDYEFLYSDTPDLRRDLCRFTAFILGQINHHNELMAKPRTLFISTTFPDVRAALPNLDILTVGSDAVELRVDLLREPLGGGEFADVPSLKFPMNNPELYHEYLYRAIQWGVEYIDVELWLPEEIRHAIWQKKGNSRIMSAFHDFSGTFKWPSSYAQEVFERSINYADIVKMIAIINDHAENFELEYFRSKMRNEYPHAPPFSAVNMGQSNPNKTTTLIFDNASWKGIVSALTRDLAPSAYAGRTAMVLASSSEDAAPVIFAMKALKLSKIYTLGFKTSLTLTRNAPPIEQFNSLESLQRARSGTNESAAPFVMVSALGPAKSSIVRLLLRAFASNGQNPGSTSSKRVFLDLAHAADRQAIETADIADKSGFAAYGAADSAAFTTVESMRLLVGQNVPYSFVRLASGN